MTNYVKGFCFSLLLHGAVLFLALWAGMAGSAPEKNILVVDFTAIALGQPNEGGSLPGGRRASGPGQEERTPLAPQQQSAVLPEQAAPPEAAFTPKPKAVMTKRPEPAATPKPAPRASASRTVNEPQRVKAPEHASATDSPEPAENGGSASGVPAGTPGGRGAGPGAGVGSGEGLAQGYVKSNFNYILAGIRRNLRYPDYARRQRLSGTARFAFVIKQDGSIENLSLKESSGHNILDEAAEKAIQQAAPFPRPQAPALLLVPISFRLS